MPLFSEVFILRRCQIVQASPGERGPLIARGVGCGEMAIRGAIHACDQDETRLLASLEATAARCSAN
jgi:hypothetical protein